MTLEVTDMVDDLRQLLARAEAMAAAAESFFNESFHTDDREERRRLERVAHFIGATISAVEAASEACNQVADALSRRGAGA